MNKTLFLILKQDKTLMEYIKICKQAENERHLLYTINNSKKIKDSFHKFFIHYMKENDILTKFENAVRTYGRRQGDRNILSIIDLSLSWADTKEGFDFWSTEDLKWKMMLRAELVTHLKHENQ